MKITPSNAFHEFLKLLNSLDHGKIAYRLRHSRYDALMIEINVPGERWEVEFVDYDDEVHIEIERFRSDGRMDDDSALAELFRHASVPSCPESQQTEAPHDAVA